MNEKRTILIDFSKADNVREIHEMLKAAFDFPDYYGRNWNALYDCLGDFCSNQEAYEVELHGFYSMEMKLRAQCAPMLSVFGDVQEEWENIVFKVVS